MNICVVYYLAMACIIADCQLPKEPCSMYCRNHICRIANCMWYGIRNRVCHAHISMACGFDECTGQRLPHKKYCAIHVCAITSCDRSVLNRDKYLCGTHMCDVDGCELLAEHGERYARCRIHVYCAHIGCDAIMIVHGASYCPEHRCCVDGCTMERIDELDFCQLHICVLCRERINETSYGMCLRCIGKRCKKGWCTREKADDSDYCFEHNCRFKGCPNDVECDQHWCRAPGLACRRYRVLDFDTCEEHYWVPECFVCMKDKCQHEYIANKFQRYTILSHKINSQYIEHIKQKIKLCKKMSVRKLYTDVLPTYLILPIRQLIADYL